VADGVAKTHAAEMRGVSMLRSGKTGRVRARAEVTAASGREADIYQRYAVGLYRQALLDVLRRQATAPAVAVEDAGSVNDPHPGASAGR
jgi:hypothetical protein